MGERQSASEIEAAAVSFALRIQQDGGDGLVRAELDRWLAADSRCAGALLQAEAALLLMSEASQGAATGPARVRRTGLPRRGLIAAGLASLVCAVGAGFAARELRGRRYRTAVGEIRRVPLADGSTVAINTQSGVAVRLADKIRHVRLDRGEAWFQVAKDSARPFVVDAGDVRVRAVGTAFSVRRRSEGVEVMVSEGVVETWVVGAGDRRMRVSAGQMAMVGGQGPVLEASGGASQVDRALAWRDGKIDLAGESLGAAVEEFNRYNTRKLVVEDPALARAPLYGIFRADDPEGFANAVAQSLGARVTMQGQIAILPGPARRS